jgi:hypothetical protein
MITPFFSKRPSIANVPKLGSVVNLTDKIIARKMSSSYTVPLLEQPAFDQDGEATRKFYFRPGGSVLTAQYILILLQHFKDIVALPTDIAATIQRGNGMSIPGRLYAIPSAALNNSMSGDVSGTKGNSRQGNAGNIAVAYFTPHREQMVDESIAARNLKLKGDLKLISAHQYKLLCAMEAQLVMGRESENLGIDLKQLSQKDLEHTISHYKEKGYSPVRIIFDHLPASLANIFNTKPVNTLIKNELQAEIASYFEKKNINARKLSSAELRREHGVSIKSYVKNNISNNKFWCVFDSEGSLRKVKLIQTRELYYGLADFDNNIVSFSKNSFVAKSSEPLGGGMNLPSLDVNGNVSTAELEMLDIVTVLKRTDYKGFSKAFIENTSIGSLDPLTYVLEKNSAKIAKLMAKTEIESVNHGDNDDDLSIISLLHKLSLDKNSVFYLAKEQTDSLVDDLHVKFKSADSAGARITSFARHGGVSKSIDGVFSKVIDNAHNNLPYFFLHKKNLSFERERAMTVLFVVTALEWLKREGHVDIEVIFEIPVNKKEGGRGYLDCVMYSKLANIQYGQAFEFKAWYTYSIDCQALISAQCDSYDINRMMSDHGVVRTYSDESVNVVKGMNLLPSGASILVDDARVPWLPAGKWGWTFEKPKGRAALREITELSVIVDDDIDVDDFSAVTSVIEVMNVYGPHLKTVEQPATEYLYAMLGID